MCVRACSCVCVALVITLISYYIVICGQLGCTTFFHNISQTARFREKNLSKKFVF